MFSHEGINSKDEHQQYDARVGRQQQQGKGFSSERTGHTEVRGLIHDKDIRMPESPQKPESTEIFPPLLEGRCRALRNQPGISMLSGVVQCSSWVQESY